LGGFETMPSLSFAILFQPQNRREPTMTLINPTPVENDTTLPEIMDFWRENGREVVKKSIDALDEVAKQILAVAGILEGLYFHAITFSNLRGQVAGWALVLYVAPVVLLLITILASLSVFFPETYRINIANWRDSKAKFEEIGKSKLLAVRIASFFLALAILGLMAAVVGYLVG